MARAQDNKLYTVDSTNKYMVSIKVINSIEEAGDDFMTFEEVAELLGVDPETGYFNCCNQTRHESIKSELLALRQQAKDANKKTIVIRDADLIAVFKEGYSVADFVPGMRRIGDRLFVEGGVKPEATLLKKKHQQAFNTICWRVQNTINHNNHFQIDLTYVNNDRHGALDFVKKIMPFDDIEFHTGDDKETIDLCRQIWDNIDSFFERKKEEVAEEKAGEEK